MDKGHLVAEKIVTNNQPHQQQTSSADNFCNKDDVLVVVSAAVKKEKSQTVAAAETGDVSSSQTKATTAATRGKEINEKKVEGKNLNEFPSDTEELLGSVTTYNCHGTRTSARVIQKMRQDQQTRPTTPPPTNERENGRNNKDERSTTQKTPSQVRANRPTWSNIERNHFFDALNEFGKDFEAIGNFINSKLKRRSPAVDVSFKSKDQVRQHYYQTYHKICKYVRFSEEVRKPAQELYALINYGEMRRKLQFVTDKHFMKLKNLVYHGHVTVRCKGKNIRIKTPSCKALRRLNQLDDSLEDIRLPSKIEVIISPANMEAFGRVQSIAQNPRCRTTVPLHKKLINFINMFQHKWRSMDVRVAEEARLMNSNDSSTSAAAAETNIVQDPELCFLPKPGVTIHRPLLSITEYLSSVNICLTAYEERMGITHKGDKLNSDRHASTTTNNTSGSVPTMSSSCNNSTLAAAAASINTKRLRTESGSEKKSPEQHKRSRNSESLTEEMPSSSSLTELDTFQSGSKQPESSSDELSDEIHELLSDSATELNVSKEDLTIIPMTTAISSSTDSNAINNTIPAVNTTSSTTTTSATISQASSVRAKTSRAINSKTTRSVFKPLLNDDIIQSIRSGWTASRAGDITIGDLYVVLGHDSKLELDYYWPAKTNSNAVPPHKESQTIVNAVATNEEPKESVMLSNKLKHLLLIANLSERMRKRPCTCDRNHAAKSKFERDLVAGTFVGNRPSYVNCTRVGPNRTSESSSSSSVMFRQPMIPVRRTTIDPVKQLTTLTRQKMSRQILVQRLLLPSNGNTNAPSRHNNSNNHPSTSTSSAITASSASLRDTSQVPWNSTKKSNVSTASDLATPSSSSSCVSTTITDDNTTDSQDLCRFLESIDCDSSQNLLSSNVELHALHHDQQQQQHHDMLEESGDDRTDGPCSVQSIDSAYDESTSNSFLNSLSPMHLVRDSTSNSRWLEENINDFSLTSLLGHLDDINASRDILDPSSSMSVISESSVDYRHKFQEIKALLPTQEKD